MILVFTGTAGFRHESIPAGVEAIRECGFDLDETEDPGVFTADRLRAYRALVFLSTSGDPLDAAGKRAFEEYVTGGGGYVGIHAASTTGYGWDFYRRAVGAWFAGHPAVQQATMQVVDRDHPATAGLDPTWVRVDEWYNFRTDPTPDVRVLVTVDESTYEGGEMGAGHPIAWCHENVGGRCFYTALGHTIEGFAEPALREHIAGGIRYALGG